MLVCPEQIPGGIPGGIVTSFTPGGDDCSHWTFDLNINSLHYEHGDDILNFNTLTINCNNALNQDRTGAYGWATNDNYHYRSGVLTTGTKNFTGYDLLNPPSTGVTVYVTCCLRTQEFDTPYLIGKFECSVP
jgi:hypothetical protein